ncbi:hypothetical protein E2C01_041123 [Portunus trituberculatus]|uniref:Uncharacterized protein n=1 Tax=Portunus trituberculatus TaxID=210409 RepID=A0A5B7FQ35_PORTR|nr:hypothetical protein [Portunus trituberculatus]
MFPRRGGARGSVPTNSRDVLRGTNLPRPVTARPRDAFQLPQAYTYTTTLFYAATHSAGVTLTLPQD